MISAMISGTTFGAFAEKQSSTGKTYVTGKVRVTQAEGEAIFVNVIVFAQDTQAQVLALDANSSVSLAGVMKIGLWKPEHGEPRLNASMVADQCLTVHHIRKRERAMQDHEPHVSPRQVRAQHQAQMPLGSIADLKSDEV